MFLQEWSEAAYPVSGHLLTRSTVGVAQALRPGPGVAGCCTVLLPGEIPNPPGVPQHLLGQGFPAWICVTGPFPDICCF